MMMSKLAWENDPGLSINCIYEISQLFFFTTNDFLHFCLAWTPPARSLYRHLTFVLYIQYTTMPSINKCIVFLTLTLSATAFGSSHVARSNHRGLARNARPDVLADVIPMQRRTRSNSKRCKAKPSSSSSSTSHKHSSTQKVTKATAPAPKDTPAYTPKPTSTSAKPKSTPDNGGGGSGSGSGNGNGGGSGGGGGDGGLTTGGMQVYVDPYSGLIIYSNILTFTVLPFTPKMAMRGLVVTHTQTLISYAL